MDGHAPWIKQAERAAREFSTPAAMGGLYWGKPRLINALTKVVGNAVAPASTLQHGLLGCLSSLPFRKHNPGAVATSQLNQAFLRRLC